MLRKQSSLNKFSWLLLSALLSTPALGSDQPPNYHLVGWANMFMPGAGQAILGNATVGISQFGYETSTFLLGYWMSSNQTFSLDGYTSSVPNRRLSRLDQVGIERNITGDMLQEFGIKAHMTNTFTAYRLAAGNTGPHPDIDQTSTLDLFLEPFQNKNLTDPWVYSGIAATFLYATIDYLRNVNSTVTVSRVNQGSNTLYAVNYGMWQPIGSGAPEEMFYHGFLQHEFKTWVDSPYFAVPLSAAAFAFSHSPPGRPTAAVAGTYLGFLAEKYDGKLGPGITLHFWSSVILGAETILLYNRAQRSSPPTSLTLQIDY